MDKHEAHGEESIQITESKENFDYWMNRDFIRSGLKEKLKSANLLIVPFEGFREYSGPIFSSGTEAAYGYLRKNSGNSLHVEICISPEDFKTLSLNSNIERLGKFVIASVVLPFALNLLASYVFQKIQSKDAESHITFSLVVVRPDKTSLEVKYEGPAEGFRERVEPLIEKALSKK